MRFPTLHNLFGLMISRGAQAGSAAVAEIPGDTATIPLSVRVQPRVKAYYEAQADACGAASVSAMVAMVLEGVMASTQSSQPSQATSSADLLRGNVSLVVERFLHLFHIHRFTPRMIADVLEPYGITLADIMDDSQMLPLLSDTVMSDQAMRFNASLEWLHGKKVRPVADVPRFGKQPGVVCNKVIDLLLESDNRRDLTVIFLKDMELRFNTAHNEIYRSERNTGNVSIVLRETYRTSTGKPYHRYQPWDSVPWDYGETRLTVKSLILWLKRLDKGTYHHVRVEGCEIDPQTLIALTRGDVLPAEVLDDASRHLKSWDPSDYVAKPEIVLAKATLPNTSARETQERAVALHYYDLYEIEDLFNRLTHVNRQALTEPVGEEWWWNH
jgi:hypothetical protein